MALFSSTTAQFILLAGHLPTSMMTPCEARGSSLKVCSLYCLEGVFSETQTSSPTELSARCCWMRLRKRTPPPTRRKTCRSIPHSTNLAGRRGRLPAYKTPYRVIEPPSSTGAANCSTHRLRYTRTVRVFFKPNNLLP